MGPEGRAGNGVARHHDGVILTYHCVARCLPGDDRHNLCVDPAAFAEQMRFLVERTSVVPLEHVMSGRPGVAVTFDDAYRSVLTTAAPILSELGLPATVFAPTKWLGHANGWDDPSSAPLDIMTARELVELQSHGIVVETHGHAHIDMSQEPADVVEADIAESLELLESITGRRPIYLAYPFGAYSTEAQRCVRSLGLKGALTIDEDDAGPWARGREQVTSADGRFIFRMKSRGLYGSLRRSRLGKAAYSMTRPVARRVLLNHR